LIVVARALPPRDYLYFGAFWSLALLVGLGVFLPVEQLLARRSQQIGRSALLRTGSLVAATMATVEIILIASCSVFFLPPLGNQWAIVVALMALCVVSAMQFVVRGILIGSDRLNTYLFVLVLDSFLRVALASGLAVASDKSTARFCWTLVGAIGLAHAAPLVAMRRGSDPSPGARSGRGQTFRARDATKALVPLLVGSLAAQTLLNGLPVVVAALARSTDQSAAGQFQAAFQLARIPLFAAVPLQTTILPYLARVLARVDDARVSALTVRLVGGVALAAALGSVGAGGAGPIALRFIDGSRYSAGRLDFAILGAGVVGYLALLVVAQALVAVDDHHMVGLAWSVGLAVAAIVFVFGAGLVRAAEVAFMLGSMSGGLAGTLLLVRALRQRSRVNTSLTI
jgi:O-antigen/teichoic acid export membrane protein